MEKHFGSWGCAKKGIKVLPTLETDRKVDKFWNSVTFHTLYSTRVPKVINFNVVYGLIVYEMFLHRMNLSLYQKGSEVKDGNDGNLTILIAASTLYLKGSP